MRSVLVIVIFAITVCIFFGDVLFGDRILLTCNPARWQPWRTYASREQLSARTYRTDSARTYLPRNAELSRRVNAGEIPLWNPYVFGGYPFFADPQSRVAYPISLLLALLDPAEALGYDIAIHFFLAMLGMYLFLRSINSTVIGSMTGALAYGFSSFFFTRMGHPTFVASASWIPFFFYGFETARSGTGRHAVLLAVFLALGYLSGFPQVFMFGVVALVVYVICHCVEDALHGRSRVGLRNAKILGVSGGLSLLLVCVQLVPFWELVRNSAGLGMRFEVMKSAFLARPLLLIRSIVPRFFGNPVEGTRWLRLLQPATHPFNPGFLVYYSVGCLIAAVAGLVFIKRSGRIRALLVLLVLSVGIATSGLLLRAAYAAVPLFRYSQIDRIEIIACFALAALGGVSLSELSTIPDERLRRYFLWIVVVLLAVTVVASRVLVVGAPSIMAEVMGRGQSIGRDVYGGMGSAKIMRWSLEGGAQWLAYERKQFLIALFFALLSVGLIAMHASRRWAQQRPGRIIPVLFMLVVLLDLGIVARSYYVSQPRSVMAETPGLEVLKDASASSGRWRIMKIDPQQPVLPTNINQVFGVYSLTGRSTVVPASFMDFVRAPNLGTTMPARSIGVTPIRPGPHTDFMCVMYLVADDAEPLLFRSPGLAAAAKVEQLRPGLRLFTVGDETRMAVVQRPGEDVCFDILLPSVAYLDAYVAFETGGGGPRDSLTALLACEGRSGRIEFRRTFALESDAGRWHPVRLDVSEVSGTYVSVTLHIIPQARPGISEPTVAWGGLDLVYDDCSVEAVENGYEVVGPYSGRTLSLEVTSSAEDMLLELVYDDGPTVLRRLGLPPGLKSRTLMITVPEGVRSSLTVRSGSAFVLKTAKIVHPAAVPSLDYDLVYDGDMNIYENFAATEKGICLDRRAMAGGSGPAQHRLPLAGLGSIDRFICGRCEIDTYEPERVELSVRSERDCYLVFQDLHYPGWKALVDGQERPILTTDMGIRAIEVDKGDHRVEMVFRPTSLKIGLGLTCLGIILSVLYAAKSKKRQEI
jgi:hypothetical protein